MRKALIVLTALAALTACSASTLPEDDQTFCAEQEDELKPALEAAEEIVDGDRHWSSDAEAGALREVMLDPASNFISAFEPQDSELASRVDAVSSALLFLKSDLLVTPDEAFADDAATSRDVAETIEALQEFCDEEG